MLSFPAPLVRVGARRWPPGAYVPIGPPPRPELPRELGAARPTRVETLHAVGQRRGDERGQGTGHVMAVPRRTTGRAGKGKCWQHRGDRKGKDPASVWATQGHSRLEEGGGCGGVDVGSRRGAQTMETSPRRHCSRACTRAARSRSWRLTSASQAASMAAISMPRLVVTASHSRRPMCLAKL